MSALDDFEEAIYCSLDEGIALGELREWLDSFEEMWRDANDDGCQERCEPDTCEDCDYFRVEEEPDLTEDEAALSQAVDWAKVIDEVMAVRDSCVCGHLGLCTGCTEPLVEQIKGDPPYVRVVSTSVEDRFDQIESLINRLFDEVRNLKGNHAPEWPKKKTLEGGPMHPQRPYLPPPVLPYIPRDPLTPWAGGVNNCSCLPVNGGSGVCHCVRPGSGPRY